MTRQFPQLLGHRLSSAAQPGPTCLHTLSACPCYRTSATLDLTVCLSLQNYFRDAWNVFDFVTVLGSITDILVTEIAVSSIFCTLLLLLSLSRAPSLCGPGLALPSWDRRSYL